MPYFLAIPEASAVLADFLPRFNGRFRAPAQQTGTAYRPLDPDICLDRILCYKHWRTVARDNTVKYRWRTLQLMPDVEPGTYTGSKVEVLEGLDGTLRGSTRGASSLHRKLRHVQESCVIQLRWSVGTFISTMRTAGGCTGTRRSRRAQLLTM